MLLLLNEPGDPSFLFPNFSVSYFSRMTSTLNYYASIDKVLSELELRFSGNDQQILCALGTICNSKTPGKESFSRIAKFYNIDGEILEA